MDNFTHAMNDATCTNILDENQESTDQSIIEFVSFDGDDEDENIEDGLTMKLFKFMGLPKSYRNMLYHQLVADVGVISSIPSSTASSFLGLVSWVCGNNQNVEGTQPELTDSGIPQTLEEKILEFEMQHLCIPPTQIPDIHETTTPEHQINEYYNLAPQTEALASTSVVKVNDQTGNEFIWKNELNLEKQIFKTIIEDGAKYEEQVMVDHNNNIISHQSENFKACHSETVLYAYGMNETEEGVNEKDKVVFDYKSAACSNTASTFAEKEKVATIQSFPDVKVGFMAPSETNIYAYQCDDDVDANAVVFQKQFEKSLPNECGEGVTLRGCLSRGTEFKKLENANAGKRLTANNNRVIEETKKKSPINEPGRAQVVKKPSIKEVSFAPIISETKIVSNIDAEETDKSLIAKPTTSDVQLQLNEDLKTLEDIVKKLYKNLNKKGPLTIVANFKPKANGELALDMTNNNLTPSPKTNACEGKPLSVTQEIQQKVMIRQASKEIIRPKVAEAANVQKTESYTCKPTTSKQTQSIMKTTPSLPIAPSSVVRKHSVSFATKPDKSTLSEKSQKVPSKVSFAVNTCYDRRVENEEEEVTQELSSYGKRILYHDDCIRSAQASDCNLPYPLPPFSNYLGASFGATGSCMLHNNCPSYGNMRVIRKCSKHEQPVQQERIQDSSSEASTSSISSNLQTDTDIETNCKNRTIKTKGRFTSSTCLRKANSISNSRSKVYIPSAPSSLRKATYSEMFREKRNQQQVQTVYVDLTSKGKEERSMKSQSNHVVWQ